jgi:hypothetical protein
MPTQHHPTHQDLIKEFFDMNLTEVQGLNLLTRHSIISDNVAFTHEIATADIVRAISFLRPKSDGP